MFIFLQISCNSKMEIKKKKKQLYKRKVIHFLNLFFFSPAKPYGVHPQTCAKKKTAAFSYPSHVLGINAV